MPDLFRELRRRDFWEARFDEPIFTDAQQTWLPLALSLQVGSNCLEELLAGAGALTAKELASSLVATRGLNILERPRVTNKLQVDVKKSSS